MKLILLGAPGAGKGTQADIIRTHLCIPSISTGNILREALKNGTELGSQAKVFMDAGKLVPDEVMIAIIKERLKLDDCKNGFILDGFPRTIAQAQALEQMHVEIDKVINIEVSDHLIENRLSGRRTCEACGATYHILNKKPLQEGVCDNCKTSLIIRKDDNLETIRERLSVYHDQTGPLKGYYEKAGKLVNINGEGSIEEITKLTLELLEA